MTIRHYDSSSDRDSGQDPATVPDYPLYVRFLATLFGASIILGPMGFFGLLLTAGWLWYRNGLQLNSTIVILALSALACPFLCQLYRWLFIQWGRWRWPESDKPIDE